MCFSESLCIIYQTKKIYFCKLQDPTPHNYTPKQNWIFFFFCRKISVIVYVFLVSNFELKTVPVSKKRDKYKVWF